MDKNHKLVSKISQFGTITQLQAKEILSYLFGRIFDKNGNLILPDDVVKLDPNTGQIDPRLIPGYSPIPSPNQVNDIDILEKVTTEKYSYDSSIDTFIFDSLVGNFIRISSFDPNIDTFRFRILNSMDGENVKMYIVKPSNMTVILNSLIGDTYFDIKLMDKTLSSSEDYLLDLYNIRNRLRASISTNMIGY